MSKIRFGIMGAGKIAEVFARAVKLTEVAETAAVASKTLKKAEQFAKHNGIADFCSYEGLLSRSDIDAVYIATTHNFHYENIKACLNHGKHVLCEKPMVLKEEEARELFDLAKNKGLFLMEAMWSRFLPSMQKAYSWIKEGKIGKIQSVSGVIGFKGDEDTDSRLMNPALAGGALYDIGVYAIEISSFLVGERIADVKGNVRRDGRTGVDAAVSFVLEFESVDACLQCIITANVKEYIVVCGDKGYIEIPAAHVNNECFLFDIDRKLTEHFKKEFPDGNGFVYEIEEVSKCISSGKTESEVMPAEATIECARVFEKLLSE